MWELGSPQVEIASYPKLQTQGCVSCARLVSILLSTWVLPMADDGARDWLCETDEQVDLTLGLGSLGCGLKWDQLSPQEYKPQGQSLRYSGL